MKFIKYFLKLKNRLYYFLKVLHLTKVFTKNKNLLRLGITRFATEFISFEGFILL